MKHALYVSFVVILLESLTGPFAAMAFAASPANIAPGNKITSSDIQQTLQNDPRVMSQANVPTKTNGSGLVAATAGATVTIPTNPAADVSLTQQGMPTVSVSLPNASSAGTGRQIAPGMMAYASNNGSANAVQTSAEGVQMITVIDSPSAPTTYNYQVSVPQGGLIQLESDGAAMIVDTRGNPIAYIAVPWAHDATGKTIQTWFTTNGLTLTQHIAHNVPGVVYPVTADPSIWKIIECTAAVGTLVALTWLGAQDVRVLGGVAKVVAALLEGGSAARNALAVFGYVSGITQVKDACS